MPLNACERDRYYLFCMTCRFFPTMSLACAICIGFAFCCSDLCAAEDPLRFNRDIRPILSENCFYCHGQDSKHREADLRLDEREGALRDLGGYAAIVPGNPAKSEIIVRMRSHDSSEVMPPPKANKTVTAQQIALLERWIEQGATYEGHWAYQPPERAPLPAVKNSAWPRHSIDHFVLARLQHEGLQPSPEAEPTTWLRRAALDTTGLPPTPEELKRFAADVQARGEDAYLAAVNQLLDSPHYGERQAIEWLDAARYADTHGFNNDSAREMWRWRDWVIQAFNNNMPYDRFITEQLAGDLLPDATVEQRIATAFNRNHVINSEGGIIDEEYRVEYVADRVRTVSTAWLGLTMECARCHNHKFDAISQRDYFSLFALFNQVPEHGEDGRRTNAVPIMSAPTTEQQHRLETQQEELRDLDKELRVAETSLVHADRPLIEAWLDAKKTMQVESFPIHDDAAWADGVLGNSTPVHLLETDAKLTAKQFKLGSKSPSTTGFWLRPAQGNGADVPLLSSIDYSGPESAGQYGKGRDIRLIDGEIEVRLSSRYPVYAVVVRTKGARLRPDSWRHVLISHTGGFRAADLRIFADGVELPLWVRYDGSNLVQMDTPVHVGRETHPADRRFVGQMDELRHFPIATDGPQALRVFASEISVHWQQDLLAAGGAETGLSWLKLLATQDLADAAQRRLDLWEQHLKLQRSLPTVMVMEELEEMRPTHVLQRGAYDAPGDKVEPGALEDLLLVWPDDSPRNRLGLARWLTHPKHPLTARVVVNRLWAQLFGTGIVKTLEDFGFQAEWPSHPEVLDWLARTWVDEGWDSKDLMRQILLSATYRQNSRISPELATRDPENRLLARGPRVRLPAELIRDQALVISGLIRHRIGGPSVFPYQPADLYKGTVVDANYPGTRWIQSKGDDLYRRSLYTFWKRTVPHPAMLTLDAPDREFCTVRRSRTNTPLQALLLWNEEGLLEAARQLGARILREGGKTVETKARLGFSLATGREPSAEELRSLTEVWGKMRAEFEAHPAGAEQLLKVGASPVADDLSSTEHAAAMMVASILLNLDETLTKN